MTVHFVTPVTGYFFIMLLAASDAATVVLWDDGKMITRCLLGSVIGSVAAVAWLRMNAIENEKPDSIDTQYRHVRQWATEFVLASALVSFLGGIAATAPAIEYFDLPLNSSVVIYTSAGISFFFIGALRLAMPLITAAYKRFITDKFNGKP